MPSGNKVKLALVFTGAVSLGSFEAGVAYEMVDYIHQQDNPKVEIDVIVGTSAGALTGALMAIALAFGIDPKDIEEAWLSVNLGDLLKLKPADKSLLSSSKVDTLIARYICPPAPDLVRYSRPGKPINLSVVVTNLDGINYRIHRADSDDFAISAIGYEDTLKFHVDGDFAEWQRLRDAVRASSAYPAAFEHKTISRVNKDYRMTAAYNFAQREERAFRYSDGGIVNNQPLNRAIEVVGDLPESASDNGFQRIFLVVDPSPPEGSDIPREYGVFDVVSRALWTIPRNQTLYKDLLLIEKVNRRLRWKNQFIAATAEIWNAARLGTEHVQALQKLSDQVALFKGQAMLRMAPEQYLQTEEKRIRESYCKEIQKVSNPDSFVKYCFLLEQVADLRNKKEIRVEMIKPQNPEQELAGVIFGNFGGFLDTNFMKHDFEVGRTYARRWLNKEQELTRSVTFHQQDLNPRLRREVLQQLLDNSVPLLVEDIGPRFFAMNKDLPKDVLGIVSFVKMFVTSLGRYVVGKSVNWVRERVSSDHPPKNN